MLYCIFALKEEALPARRPKESGRTQSPLCSEGVASPMTNRIRLLLISVSCALVFYIALGGVLGKGNSSTEKTYRDLGVYTEVLSRIKQDYVTEPNLKKVTNGAIRGLLESLDPYSTYFSPQEYQDYLAHPNPGPADAGIFLSKKMGFATVVSVLPGSSAEKAGIKAGDLIDRVETTPTRELSVIQIDRMLAGATGTTVNLSVVKGSSRRAAEDQRAPRGAGLPSGGRQAG